jgi:hypothetical protein
MEWKRITRSFLTMEFLTAGGTPAFLRMRLRLILANAATAGCAGIEFARIKERRF